MPTRSARTDGLGGLVGDDARPGTRRLARVVGALAVVLVVAAVAIAWYFAEQLTLPPDPYPYEPDVEVLSVDGDTVTLTRTRFSAVPGSWGLQVDGRNVLLTEQLAIDDDTVTWRWEGDAFTPSPGPAKVDEYVWSTDPAQAHGLSFDEVTVDGPTGTLPAWWVPATGAPAGTVVFVHGRGATRAEALRFLPALHAAGWEVLVTTYRGDDGAPPWPDDRVRFGTTEWADVAAAVDHVADRDGPLVLYASSMGGALVAQALDRSPQVAAAVDAVVLDSPLLSLDHLLDLQAGLNGLPAPTAPIVLPLVQLFADLRFDLETASLEQAEADDTFDLPVLLFHGDEDAFVPFDGSRELAEVDAEHVTWIRVPAAGHVRTWNHDRDTYEAALTTFLTTVADR